MAELEQLEERLGHRFARRELLSEALTHRSVVHENGPPGKAGADRLRADNQRLEFFGDAVLQLALTEAIFERFPDGDEGQLTKLRARLANRHMLCHMAQQLSLGDFLRLGKGEEASGGRSRLSNLADVFESVVGALYLDCGYDQVRRFIHELFRTELERLEQSAHDDNPKGMLQEMLQDRHAKNPVYRIASQTGPDHAKHFEVVVEFNGRELGRGVGGSKKEAEMRAAVEAVATLQSEMAKKSADET